MRVFDKTSVGTVTHGDKSTVKSQNVLNHQLAKKLKVHSSFEKAIFGVTIFQICN